MSKLTNHQHLKMRWEHAPPRAKRRITIGLLLLAAVWVSGAMYAYTNVWGIYRLEGGLRVAVTAVYGPWGFITWLLQMVRIDISIYWMWLIGFQLLFVLFLFVNLSRTPHDLVQQQWQQEAHGWQHGHLIEVEAAKRLGIKQGIPLAVAANQLIGMDYKQSEGHGLIVGPTRSGKGLHLTQTLLSWPGAVVCIDPKGEQYERCAGYREQFGDVYRIPGHKVDLSRYYNLRDGDDITELHHHLLQPWRQKNRVFADKAKTLFALAGLYAHRHGLNPIRVLLDAAESDPVKVLTAFAAVAPEKTRQFTDGLAPDKYTDDRFATSAYGTFTTQLGNYQKHIDTIAPDAANDMLLIPQDWAVKQATIFITYSLNELKGVGGVVAAIIAALMRHQVATDARTRMLVAIDELPAVGLENVETYLATVGGYGITLLLYAQAFSQLQQVYGYEGAQSIIANCKHQVWYPPADIKTAEFVSRLYGTSLQLHETHSRSTSRRKGIKQDSEGAGKSHSLQAKVALEPTAVMSMDKRRVVVQTESDRLYRFIAQRLEPFKLMDKLPVHPGFYETAVTERVYTRWETAVSLSTNSAIKSLKDLM